MRYLILAAAGVVVIYLTPWFVAQLGRRYGSNDVAIAKPRYL